mmetsp:Transcript_14921/g.46712  ORF Transcript_14921/g.46712 Transcript_14921/m.46712 type:complete len:310 (+) Transcript_14921:283-1212(+)
MWKVHTITVQPLLAHVTPHHETHLLSRLVATIQTLDHIVTAAFIINFFHMAYPVTASLSTPLVHNPLLREPSINGHGSTDLLELSTNELAFKCVPQQATVDVSRDRQQGPRICRGDSEPSQHEPLHARLAGCQALNLEVTKRPQRSERINISSSLGLEGYLLVKPGQGVELSGNVLGTSRLSAGWICLAIPLDSASSIDHGRRQQGHASKSTPHCIRENDPVRNSRLFHMQHHGTILFNLGTSITIRQSVAKGERTASGTPCRSKEITAARSQLFNETESHVPTVTRHKHPLQVLHEPRRLTSTTPPTR